jgi:hypothetical protein
MLNLAISLEQLLLLKAAVFPPNLALTYWQKWLNHHKISQSEAGDSRVFLSVIGTIDHDSQRLMPLIYRNLKATSDVYIPHLRSIYRVSWLKNHKHLLKLQTLLTGLEAAGIGTILLKGLPLSMRYYGDMGVRMTSDVDFLVPTNCADKALEVLQNPVYGLHATAYETKNRGVLHAMHLFDPKGVDVDLHWNLMIQHAYPGADAPFWAHKQPITLPNGKIGYTLSPTHQVFHNLVHGFHWGQVPAIRWIPDCYVIYRDETAVDWHQLIDLSEHYQMRIPIQQGLQLLRDEFGLTLPDSVRHRLDSLAVSTTEQHYFTLLTQSSSTALSKGMRYVRKIQLGYRLFRNGKPGLSLRQYFWGHLNLRLGWDKRDLPY